MCGTQVAVTELEPPMVLPEAGLACSLPSRPCDLQALDPLLDGEDAAAMLAAFEHAAVPRHYQVRA